MLDFYIPENMLENPKGVFTGVCKYNLRKK